MNVFSIALQLHQVYDQELKSQQTGNIIHSFLAHTRYYLTNTNNKFERLLPLILGAVQSKESIVKLT